MSSPPFDTPPPPPAIDDSHPVTPPDPPPPYPSSPRRSRRPRRHHDHHHPPDHACDDDERSPLLGRRPPGGLRPRAFSQSSTTPSLGQALTLDLDSDIEDNRGADDEADNPPFEEARAELGLLEPHVIPLPPRRRRSRFAAYFRPLIRRPYWAALFHLLVLNFPYALVAAVYSFVFTLVGTTLLVALPLGAVVCFFDLLGARALARGEVLLQTTFHGPLGYELVAPLPPIFTRTRPPPLPPQAESAESGPQPERSFYRNTYAMFTDPTSYHALFYFIVIKPSVTLLLSLLLVIIVPVAFALVIPAPAVLRLVRRLGIWQANIAVEGLYAGGTG